MVAYCWALFLCSVLLWIKIIDDILGHFTKVMVACSVVCTVFILNFHERTVDTHEVGHLEL